MTTLTPEERMSLTRRVMALLNGWGLSASDVHRVLDLPDRVKARSVARFMEDEPLPDDPRVMRRLGFLLRIEDALHTYFPLNPEMRSLWVRKGNRQFGRRAPIAVMVDDGERGLVQVLSHLDCTYAWDATGSRAPYGRQASNP